MGNSNSIDVKYVAYIHSHPISTLLNMVTIEFSNGKKIPERCYEIKDVKEFLTNIPPSLQQKSTAVFLNVFNFTSPHFSSSDEFCESLAAKFISRSMFFRFISNETFLSTAFLSAYSKSIDVEKIVGIALLNDEISMDWMKLRRQADGFEFMSATKFSETPPISEICICEKILVFHKSTTKTNILLQNLKSAAKAFDNLFIIEKSMDYCISEGLIEMVNHLDDSAKNKFHVLPYCEREFYISEVKNWNNLDERFMVAKLKDLLPLTKKCIVPRSARPYYVSYVDSSLEKSPIVSYASPKVNAHHRLQLTLTINENNFATLYQEPLMILEAKALLKTLPGKMKEDPIHVIAFFDNSSIIYLWKNNGYQFLDSWNGIYGTDLFISFLEENPAFRNIAKDMWLEKPSYVVYDLLKILSMPSDSMELNPNWNLTSDDENPILLEFDNFDGIRIQKTPISLMTMLIEDHLKVIKAETGAKPTKIGFYFFDSENLDKIKAKFSAVCKNLNIEFCFVQHYN